MKQSWFKRVLFLLFGRKRRKKDRERYIQVCLEARDRIREKRNSLSQQLEDRVRQAASLLSELTAVGGQKKEVELELNGLTQMVGQKSRKASAEFNELLAIPEVSRLEVKKDLIRIITKPIVLEQGDLQYPLGYYAIEIIGGTEIKVRNLDNRGLDQTFDHPHVKEGYLNLPVYLRAPLAKLLMGLEYADITQIVVNILKSYQPEQAYIALENNWKGEKHVAQSLETNTRERN